MAFRFGKQTIKLIQAISLNMLVCVLTNFYVWFAAVNAFLSDLSVEELPVKMDLGQFELFRTFSNCFKSCFGLESLL